MLNLNPVGDMEIKAKEIKIVEIDSIIPNPENNNEHSEHQKEQLKKAIKYNGFRSPLTVSNRSGFLVKGHLRLEVAKELGLTHVPVIFQDYDNEAQEYADLTADNAIGLQSVINYGLVNAKIVEFGPEFDVDVLGIKDFKIDVSEVELPELNATDPDCQQVTFTLSNEQKDFLDQAMNKAKSELDCTDEINKNSNGNVLGAILRHYVYS